MACDDEYAFTTSVTLYKDRDNAVTIVPYSNIDELTNYDMSSVTKVQADADVVGDVTVGNSVSVDSDDPSGAVYWDQNNVDLEWRIYCKVGLFTGIAAGDYTLRITIFDDDHQNGLVLPGTDSSLVITIVDLP